MSNIIPIDALTSRRQIAASYWPVVYGLVYAKWQAKKKKKKLGRRCERQSENLPMSDTYDIHIILAT